MKAKYIVIILIILLGSAQLWAVDMPGVNSSVLQGTVPPSSRGSGLRQSINPVDSSANLVITGNVGDGKYFRGVVPYQSTYYFRGNAASTSLDTFLRDSVGMDDVSQYSRGTRQFYSPTQSTTRIQTGTTQIVTPPVSYTGSFIRSQAQGYNLYYGRTDTPKESVPGKIIDFKTGTKIPGEFDGVVPGEPGEIEAPGTKIEDTEDQQTLKFRQELAEVKKRAEELEHNILNDDQPPKPFEPENIQQDLQQQQKSKRIERSEEKSDVYEKMIAQIKELEETSDKQDQEKTEQDKKQSGQEQGSKGSDSPDVKDQQQQILPELNAAKAKAILGQYNTFAGYSNDRFNKYIREGEKNLKQGRYYKAADAYTMASVYRPDNPLAYAGKSHALFAAGEYMSSALFLARTLEIFPEYAMFKVDVEAMVGDKDKLETRVAEVEEIIKVSDAGELQFLLGYVYYQMGRTERAGEMIDKADQKLGRSKAVSALKEVIDSISD